MAVTHDFIKLIAAGATTMGRAVMPRAVHHARSALRFGDEVAARFAGAGATSSRLDRLVGADPDAAGVPGLMNLVHTHDATRPEGMVSRNGALTQEPAAH